MVSQLPDPDLVRAFGRAMRAHFEEELARECEQVEARRSACGRDVHVIEMAEAPSSLKERVRQDGVPL
jgi:hypothetical protein